MISSLLARLADLISQFLLCIKHLVQQRQLPKEQEDDTWIMIRRILAGSSTKQHHSAQHAHLALEIMVAFEKNLPDIENSDDNDQDYRSNASREVEKCAGRIIWALPQGGLGDSEPHARRIVSAIRGRMDRMSIILQPEDQKRWDTMLKNVSGDDN